MFMMSNQYIERVVARALSHRAVDWLAGVGEDPRVCVVLDDHHLNDHPGDAAFIHQLLVEDGYDATLLAEPAAGLTPETIAGCDVVWFTNPGQPVDDALTVVTLTAFMQAGGDLILSGDDMSRDLFVPMGSLTHTANLTDGRTTCGMVTDDDLGPGYRVDIENVNHPVIEDFQGGSFRYGDDIDHAVPLGEGEDVLAWASLYCHPDCPLQTPAIIAYCPPGGPMVCGGTPACVGCGPYADCDAPGCGAELESRNCSRGFDGQGREYCDVYVHALGPEVSCDEYCGAFGSSCLGAWDERNNTCEPREADDCDGRHGDLICRCSL